MRLKALLPAVFISALIPLLAACPTERGGADGTAETSPATASATDTAAAGAASAASATESDADLDLSQYPDEAPPPRQLILIYTGDTLSKIEPGAREDPPVGGLSALAATITDYERTIVDFNRRRILNQGGDPAGIQADLERGLLGEHPFMLLDYGGWSRPNDFAGAPYVALYLEMFQALHYTAVGCKLYERLPPERWQAYREIAPADFKLLISAGKPNAGALPAVPIYTREVHGKRWGVAAVPLPRIDDDPVARIDEYTEQARTLLAQAGCDLNILMLSEGPYELYQTLARDDRFTVVIGAPPRLAAPEGHGDMPASGALLLPEIEGGGRELGVCHLYYTEAGEVPQWYYFSIKPVLDDPSQPYPFRAQVAEARAEHDALVAEYTANHPAPKQAEPLPCPDCGEAH